MTRATLHMPARFADPGREAELVEACQRLILAKSRWTRCATDVLTRKATASDVDAALAELDKAHAAIDMLNRRGNDS